MWGSPAKVLCQVLKEMSATTCAPGASSDCEISRPAIGGTASVSNNPPLTYAAVTRTGCVFPARFAPPVTHASSDAQEYVSRRKSKHSDPEVQNRCKPPFGN